MISRVTVIVLDGLGVGELPDAAVYGDTGTNTLAHVADAVGGLALTNLEALGLGYIGDFTGVQRMSNPESCFGKMGMLSKGKDSTTGHWEMAGVVLETPFPVYPKGLPDEVIQQLQQAIGRKVLGNRTASGTDILEEFGEEHLRTGSPIVYTSGDSVLQIACHEQVIPVDELYRICRAARKVLVPPHQVARVIARPFDGSPGAFVRTERRRDFSVEPPGQSLLDVLTFSGQPVVGIGKITDLFTGRGVMRSSYPGNNAAGVNETLRALKEVPRGLIFTNLADFDTLYAHRNDPSGYAKALEEFDARVPELVGLLRHGDLLCLTADHGHDPTRPVTDHSREFVPLLAYGPRLARGVNLGTRRTLADLGQTIADALGAKRLAWGDSFLDALASG
ncbi:MAG: phosphopentomutase [Nitrospiraceae bacterium]